MYLLCLRFVFSHFLLFDSLKIQTHSFPKFNTSHQWLLTYGKVPQTKFFFCVWEAFRKQEPQNDKKKTNTRVLRKNKVPFSQWKPQSPDHSRDIYSFKTKTLYGFCYVLSWEFKFWQKIITCFFLFWISSEMHTCKEKYRCTDEWYSITVMLRSKTRT